MAKLLILTDEELRKKHELGEFNAARPNRRVVPRCRPPSRPVCRAIAPLVRERARLRAHFRKVLAELSARDISHLSAVQRATRTELLEELARYARAGRFPRNLDFPGRRVPYFVDAFGTRCAMAHLIESTGGTALVAHVAGAMNNALVHELAADLALQAWLEQTGLTATEAARIQPSYCFVPKGEWCFCNSVLDPVGVLEATVLARLSSTQVTARVDAIHGDASGTTVGKEITVSSSFGVADAVLIQVWPNTQMMPNYGNVHRVQNDGTIELLCGLSIPTLSKTDAIAAMLTKQTAGQYPSACSEQLKKLDARWGESSCEKSSDRGAAGGCSIGTTGVGSPLLLGTALAFAVVWSWRRRASSRG